MCSNMRARSGRKPWRRTSDSVGHIRLILACEQAFGCRFEPKEVVGLQNVGELVAMIRQKTA